MLRNISDVITFAKNLGPNKTLELIEQKKYKFTLPSLKDLIQIYDIGKNIFCYLSNGGFGSLNINSQLEFTNLAKERPDVANFIFERFSDHVYTLYRSDNEMRELASTFALSYEAAVKCTPKHVFLLKYKRCVEELLVDFKTFAKFDAKTKQGIHYSEHFYAKILPKMDNFADLNQLEPATAHKIFSEKYAMIIDAIESIYVLTEILTHIKSISSFNLSYNESDQVKQIVKLLTQEDKTTAATILCDMAIIVPDLTIKLLKQSPVRIVPLIDRTHFLILLGNHSGVCFAAELLSSRPERCLDLLLPVSNFIEVLTIDQKSMYPFVNKLINLNEITDLITSELKTADEFISLVNADRYVAYTLLEKQLRNILRLFKEIELPKSNKLSDEQLNLYINKIDGIIERKNQKNTQEKVSVNSQTLFNQLSEPLPLGSANGAAPVMARNTGF